MSKITLKPLDDGQKVVEIPIGRTTIGRGSFLGCSDKKVSRNHAVLEVTDSKEVFITPTHVNPCFYQPTVDSPGIILKKDKPQKLSNGDSFSLLPRAFRYQLIVAGEPTDAKSNQNDFKIQSEKTNGETSSSDEQKNPKDVPKESSQTDLFDKGSNKPLSKGDSPRSNAFPNSENKESNSTYQEDRLVANDHNSAKNDPIQSTEQLTKDSVSEHKDIEEEDDREPETNNVSNREDDIAEKGDKDSCNEEKPLDKEEEEEESVSENKIVDESESTLGHDVFLREDKASKDGTAINAKDQEKDAKSDSGEKSDSSKGIALDDAKEASIASADENGDRGRDLPEWLDDMSTPIKKGKGGRKKNPAPKPKKEKSPPKRKTEVTPKSKPRKKQNKFDFLDGGEGSSQRPVGERTSSRTNRQTRQGLSLEDFIVSDDDEWQSDRSEPKRRRKRGGAKRGGGNESGSDWEVDRKKPKKTPQKAGSGSESDTDWGSQKKKKLQGLKGKRRKSKTTNQSETGSDAEAEEPSSFVAKGEKRIPCTYGKKCYRKNPNHTDQFSHPGDSDYTSEPEPEPEVSQKPDAISESEEEENDPEVETKKKECPYGSNCFRKNPQHQKDFKHTKKVRPQREAAKQASKKAKGSKNSDEIDSYDLNDSLLNEDSDEYKPVDSGSDYENGGKMKRFAKGKSPKNKRGKKV